MNEWIRFTESDLSEHCILVSTISRIDRYEDKLYITFSNEEDYSVYCLESADAAVAILDKLVLPDRVMETAIRKLRGAE